MFHRAIYENTRPDGVGVLEIVGLENDRRNTSEDEKPSHRFVPLKRSELRGEIVGPLAGLRLRQTFSYTSAACAKTLEALYRFPLPGDAAITGVTVHFGDVEIVATLQERAAAEAEYETAKAQGRQATLTTREAPDVFTLQVAGLQPDQDIVVETSYVQLARREGSRWSLRVPLTTAPRYTRSDERGARPAQGQPLALFRDPGHRFLLDLHLRGIDNVTSTTHELTITSTDTYSTLSEQVPVTNHPLPEQAPVNNARVQLRQGEVIPDRDCLLYWSMQQNDEQPRVSLFSQTPSSAVDQHLYFLVEVAPPRRPSGAPLPREIILLVDHSGSMTGPKWAAADWAVERFLGDLQEQDSFALGIFHNTTRWFAPQVQGATQIAITQAVAWLKNSTDSGGTELGVALEQALRLPRCQGEVARHLLILTDAAVTDADRILRLADSERERAQQNGTRRRISVICIDAAPNAFLAQELAERGGGVAKFLTSDPTQEDITTALDDVLTTWAEPLYVDLQLHIHHPQAELSDQQTIIKRNQDKTVVDLGDLAGGQTRWLAGRIPGTAKERTTFSLQLANGTRLAHQSLGADSTTTTANLRALFGARRVNGLEYLVHAGLTQAQVAEQLARLGYDADGVFADQTADTPMVYAENARTQLAAALHVLLVNEALRYGLASAETAFVATRQEAGERVQGQVLVANALPAGWSDQFVTGAPPMMPQSALRAGGLGVSMAAMPMAASMTQPFSGFMASAGSARRAERTLSARAPQPSAKLALSRAGGQNKGGEAVLFRGEPSVNQGEALLYSSAQQPETLPDDIQITGISLRLLNQEDDPAQLSREIDRATVLHLFIGDPASPRARIRLQDLLRYGERPLNLTRPAGQPVQLRLVDPNSWLQQHPLPFELLLHW